MVGDTGFIVKELIKQDTRKHVIEGVTRCCRPLGTGWWKQGWAHMCFLWLEKSKKASGRRQGLAGDLLGRQGLVRGQQGRISGQRINTSQGRESEMSTAGSRPNETADHGEGEWCEVIRLKASQRFFSLDVEGRRNQPFFVFCFFG